MWGSARKHRPSDAVAAPAPAVQPASAAPPETPARSDAARNDEVMNLVEADILRAQGRLAETAAAMRDACGAGARDIAAIRTGCDSLAEQTERARASAKHLSETLDSVFRTNEEIDRQAKASDTLAASAGNAASEASAAIVELRGAIAEIRAVVSLISDIAGQTNLLALNATIEAARAGDMGKGFAVVAGEVKALATQTRQATGDISAKIERLMQAAETSTDAVDRIIGAIGEIRPVAFAVAEAVTGQTQAISGISRTAGEVTAVAEAVDQSARTIGDATHTAAATQDAINASSAEMGAGTEEMSRHLLTVLRQTPMGNRRRHPRWPVEIGGRLRRGTRTVQVRTFDLSLGGALLSLQEPSLRAGERCTLELDGVGALQGRIAGLSPLGCHFAFDELGAPAVAAQLTAVADAYAPITSRAVRSAKAIAEVLEQALKAGEFTERDLFDTNYRPIPGTDPVQFETRALKHLERHLTSLQEAIVREDPQLSFAAAIDVNGYLPVHNTAYSKPQRPGDRIWNTANCRNRRIFDDRAGLLAARNLEPYLIQVYARDLGDTVVMMREVDSPIHVRGRHWGAFRTAYRL